MSEDLWRCPACGQTFVGRNMPHSCQVAAPRRDQLAAHLVLRRPLESARFVKVEHIPPHSYVHHLRVRRIEDVDDELRGWLAEAYAVGEQHRGPC